MGMRRAQPRDAVAIPISRVSAEHTLSCVSRLKLTD